MSTTAQGTAQAAVETTEVQQLTPDTLNDTHSPAPAKKNRWSLKPEKHNEKQHHSRSATPSDNGTNTTTTKINGKGQVKKELKALEDAANKQKEEFPPVPFFALYRFTTKFEVFLNLVGIVCAVASGAAQPLMTLMFGNLTVAFVDFGTAAANAFQSGASPEAFAALQQAADHFRSVAAKDALYLVCIGIGMFATTYLYMVTWIRTSEVAAKRIRERYLQAILRQDVAFFDTVGAGEVATRIQTDTHLVQLGISEKVPVAVSFMGAFVAGFILAFVRNWKLALACASIVPCIAITGGLMNFFISKLKLATLGHVAESGSLAEEVISTIRTAQAFGTQHKLAGMYDVHIERAHSLDKKMAVINGLGLGVFFFVIYSAYGLAFSFGTTLLLRGEVDVGVIVNVFLAILIGSFSLAMLAPELTAISNARGAASKLFATIDRVPPIDSASPDGLKPHRDSIKGEIVVEDVRFNYPSRPDVPILKGVTLTFPPGKTAALVGASGSGKSTIVALVERFYDPLEGRVLLDGTDIRELNVKWLRSQIGLVSQEPTLFATTIRGNVEHGLIGTGMENLPDEERFAKVKEACIKANADGFISALPDGYDTLVGERGFLLSGGQKQRIAIARAIVSDPKVLLLDEATSALDTQSEGVVQNALDKASKGRTTITIAHRLSTIKDAETIFVMGDGQVLEQGTHAELLRDTEGPYAKLVAAQKLREQQMQENEINTSGTNTPLPPSYGGPTQSGEHGLESDPAAMMKARMKAQADKEKQIEEEAAKEKPLGRTDTSKSLASEILKQRLAAEAGDGKGEKEYGMWYILRRMAIINKDSWKHYVLGFTAAACTGMVYPAFGIVYGRAMEAFQSTGRELRVKGDRAALWFFLIAIASTIAIQLQNMAFMRTAGDLSFRLRHLGFRAILRQDIAYFDDEKHSTGSLTSSLSQNPEKISGLAGVTLGAIVQAIVTVIGGSVIGLAYGWKLALVGIACIPFVISAGYVRLRVVVMKDQINKHAHEDSAQLACEAAGAIKTVASLTREEDCLRLYSKSLEEPLRVSNRSAFNSTFWFALSQSMVFFVIALVFWYGSRLVASLEYNTFQFFVCLMSVTFGGVQAGNVFAFVPDISESHIAGSNLVALFDSTPEVDSESTEGKKIEKVRGRIEVKDVHFRYPTRPGVRVLRHFNLTVEPGTHVALVGASGSGKSTIIQLIERFYDPLAGEVVVDGENIADLNVQEYRKNLALVSQEPTLYAGTVRFNILLGATKPVEEVTQQEIEAACRDANILDFINSLPDGFETEVGGKGSQLSGGQKQRIAIARALLRNPSILLLDEATSALDSNSERVVQDALDRAAKGRTTISIAHRLASIQKCDKIHFVSEGRIVESGTHDELLRLNGKYAEYVLLQDLSGQAA
ncbi:probable Leptomycin B resistance protein pmd1 [Serendipita indica DSM 11827]|uniref:Probable Leptomycin B resistance protein pmd1 n=1 Tax=Serendipita indica (strain DSM 11827) TaxID=1109443 RepID=G4TWW7_SERID|nr:probable Leptomycin B resistance protein pmd1 [Serendipita indica DSM 11827]